jgi:hypothetical protein
MTKIFEHNVETNEAVEREMTTQELAQLQKDKTKAENELAVATQAEADKAALLAKLGITAEEAQLLLGGN